MSSMVDFAAELVRAANRVEQLDSKETRRLLNQAMKTIRNMREQIGISESQTAADVVSELQVIAVAFGWGKRTDSEIASALLKAADMIRDLQIASRLSAVRSRTCDNPAEI
ncbi:CII family transcriptional regulator [Neorhizobium galegae]|uniref:CII family transcriptional regulator n=1 Tax=Neorhizobium galegae TaxID=399 RepID=UPI00351CE764